MDLIKMPSSDQKRVSQVFVVALLRFALDRMLRSLQSSIARRQHSSRDSASLAATGRPDRRRQSRLNSLDARRGDVREGEVVAGGSTRFAAASQKGDSNTFEALHCARPSPVLFSAVLIN